MRRAKRISRGHYHYMGYSLSNCGYYPPDRCVWWEAVSLNDNCAWFHGNTKRELMQRIDEHKNLTKGNPQ